MWIRWLLFSDTGFLRNPSFRHWVGVILLSGERAIISCLSPWTSEKLLSKSRRQRKASIYRLHVVSKVLTKVKRTIINCFHISTHRIVYLAFSVKQETFHPHEKSIFWLPGRFEMISNLATTVFCCINEMFHFQRDCQDIVETVLHCSTTCCFPTPPQHQNKVLCLVFSRRTVTLFLTLEDTIFSKFSSI